MVLHRVSSPVGLLLLVLTTGYLIGQSEELECFKCRYDAPADTTPGYPECDEEKRTEECPAGTDGCVYIHHGVYKSGASYKWGFTACLTNQVHNCVKNASNIDLWEVARSGKCEHTNLRPEKYHQVLKECFNENHAQDNDPSLHINAHYCACGGNRCNGKKKETGTGGREKTETGSSTKATGKATTTAQVLFGGSWTALALCGLAMGVVGGWTGQGRI